MGAPARSAGVAERAGVNADGPRQGSRRDAVCNCPVNLTADGAGGSRGAVAAHHARICARAGPTRMSTDAWLGHPRIGALRRLANCRRAVGDPRPAFRIINHELRGAIPLPASAENLQENFCFRLNKPSVEFFRRPAPFTGRNRRWLRHRRSPRPRLRHRRRPSRSATGCPGRPSPWQCRPFTQRSRRPRPA